MLLYIPSFLGFIAFNAHEVSGISAVQVLFASIAGVWAFRKENYLNKSLILIMGTNILIGSFIGGYGSKYLTVEKINFTYAILATIAAVMMLFPKKGLDHIPHEPVTYNKILASILALIIGASAGIVGAAGAFILVPVLLVVLKIPTKMTIATSLAITFISSIGTTVGKVMTNQVLYIPALIMIVASILASPLGANLSKKVDSMVLRGMLAILILGTAIKIWFDIIS